MNRKFAAAIAAGVVLAGGCPYGPLDTSRESDEPAPVLMPFKKGGLWGYGDEDGRVVIEPRFDEAWVSTEGIGAVRSGTAWGFVRHDGTTIVEPRFDEVRRFSEGLAPFRTGSTWGYVDREGAVVIEPRFELAWPHAEGLASIRIDGKSGYIDGSGQTVIEPVYEFAGDFSEGLAAVKTGGRVGFIDPSGAIVVEPAYRNTHRFGEGLAPVYDGSAWFYIDRAGTRVLDLPPDASFARAFSEGRALVQFGSFSAGYIDRSGEFIGDRFYFGFDFAEGSAAVCLDGGVEIGGVDPSLEFIKTYQRCSRSGFIGPDGNLSIEGEFESTFPFTGGFAHVLDGERGGYIDATGRWILGEEP